jgi:hypothetical protein
MLYDLCMRAYGEPNFKERNAYRERVRDLRQWVAGRWSHGTIIGAKHPKFCFMVPEIVEAWPTAKLVVVDRPVVESVVSLVKAGWWKAGIPDTGTQWSEALLRRMLAKRDADLQAVPPEKVLRLNYLDVVANREAAIEQLIAFTGLAPSSEQRTEALAHIDQSLRRNCTPETATP